MNYYSNILVWIMHITLVEILTFWGFSKNQKGAIMETIIYFFKKLFWYYNHLLFWYKISNGSFLAYIEIRERVTYTFTS